LSEQEALEREERRVKEERLCIGLWEQIELMGRQVIH
jgi:hypothetical protein